MDNYKYFVESEPETAFRCPSCGEPISDEGFVKSKGSVKNFEFLVYQHADCIFPTWEFQVLAVRK